MEEDIKQEELDLDNLPDAEEEEDEDFAVKGDYQQQLLKACQRGDYETTKKCLDKKANIFIEDKKKWTPLVWASCKGYIEIVRLLLSRSAGNAYCAPISEDQEKIKMGTINSNTRPSPLQWACFKCHLGIVWLLLKQGLNWREIDSFGNNSVHLAASGGHYSVFESMMVWGVELHAKNTRGHEVGDLATNKDILWLIKRHDETKDCPKCHQKFSETFHKHWCRICKNFYCKNEMKIEWVYEQKDSIDREKLEGKCLDCFDETERHIKDLQMRMEGYKHQQLKEKLDFIQDHSIEIDIKLLHEAQLLQEKLKTQDAIQAYLNNWKVVENYKGILKAINVINSMVDEARSHNIILDEDILELVKRETDRLFSERQLRFQLDNLDVYNAKSEEVKTLEELSGIARDKGVADCYLDDSGSLIEKMSRSIRAKTIFKEFSDYPWRDIPPPIRYDPKTKKPLDPVTGKPIDPKKLAEQQPKKKKKKKEPKFIIPEWANEVGSLDKEIKCLEGLLKEKEELGFEEEFIVKSKEKISHMKEELRYRKQLEEEKNLADKEKDKKKKK